MAEKLETILSRGELNGRMKDFYDIYLIYTTSWNNINISDFRNSIRNTFSRREYAGEPYVAINFIRESSIMRQRWNSYTRKNKYASKLDFDEILDCIENITKQIDSVVAS